jgi:hypothetical protein
MFAKCLFSTIFSYNIFVLAKKKNNGLSSHYTFGLELLDLADSVVVSRCKKLPEGRISVS